MTAHPEPWTARFRLPPGGQQALDGQLAALEQPPGLADAIGHLLERAQEAGVAPAWLAEPAAARALVRIGYAAPFLLRRLAARPHALAAQAGAEGESGGGGVLAGLGAAAGLLPFPPDAAPELDEGELMRRMRGWKYDNFARLTALALLGRHDTRLTCALLSQVADGLIRLAWRHAFAGLAAGYGLPRTAAGALAGGTVIAMGKLGAGELNYASDIDLIFIHEGDDTPCRRLAAAPAVPGALGEDDTVWWARWEQLHAGGASAGEPGTYSSAEFHQRLARQVVRLLGAETGEGIGFRVDVDLRPQGRSGLLAPSLAFLRDYYLVHGREWERTAMLKARPVGGSPALGERFRELIRPFVYRRYLDYSALEGIAIVKHDINRTHRAALARNLKLGEGGIRENEFFVQALQLLYGGRKPELQVSSHGAAVERLVAAGIVAAQDGATQLADYWLLREVENRVQMVGEVQTQDLPEDPAERLRVLHDFAPGFRERLPQALARLEQARARTGERFRQLFAGMGEQELPEAEQWQDAVRRRLPEDRQPEAFARIDAMLNRLMQSRMGERCVAKVARLLTRAELYGTGTEPAFPRWLDFMEQIGNRNSIFTLIAGNPSIVGWISTIFREGGIHAQRLIRHPEFLESYFSLASAGPESFGERFAALLETARDDEEFILEVQVARSQALIQILTEYLNHPERRRHRALLAELADATVDVCTRYAWRTMVRRFGLPAGARDEAAVHGFAVLGLGKLGSRELHFASDLDLVFLYREDGSTAGGRSHNEFYTKLAQRLGTLLTAPSQFGFLYELDQRLRPFGNKGVLAPSLGAYREFLPLADVWSFQAFTRIRPLCGDAALAGALIGDIGRAWRTRSLGRGQIAGAVREMLGRLVEAQAPRPRDRGRVIPLKFAIGGMIGFEFLRQAHFLIERSAEGDWTPPPDHDTIRQLEPAYAALGDLDERLAFYVGGYRHEAAPEHFERLAAIRNRWSYTAVREATERLAGEIERCFAAFANSTR